MAGVNCPGSLRITDRYRDSNRQPDTFVFTITGSSETGCLREYDYSGDLDDTSYDSQAELLNCPGAEFCLILQAAAGNLTQGALGLFPEDE